MRAARFVRQYHPSTDDYLTVTKPLDGMTVEEIYGEAVCLQAESKKA